jgi:hypothetical protein
MKRERHLNWIPPPGVRCQESAESDPYTERRDLRQHHRPLPGRTPGYNVGLVGQDAVTDERGRFELRDALRIGAAIGSEPRPLAKKRAHADRAKVDDSGPGHPTGGSAPVASPS